MNQYEEICKDMGLRAKAAAFELAQLDQGTLDAALLAIADAVEAQTDEIMAANKQDLDKSGDYNVPQTMIDRLTLTPNRIAQWLKVFVKWPLLKASWFSYRNNYTS